MNILVCIKQVPVSSNVKIDPVTGTLIRDGSNVKMNPYDLNALELALQLINNNIFTIGHLITYYLLLSYFLDPIKNIFSLE